MRKILGLILTLTLLLVGCSPQVKQVGVRQLQAKQEETKQEETKQEEVKKEETKQEEVKKDQAKQEETKREEVKQEEAKQEEVKQEETKQEEENHSEPEEVVEYEEDHDEEYEEERESYSEPSEYVQSNYSISLGGVEWSISNNATQDQLDAYIPFELVNWGPEYVPSKEAGVNQSLFLAIHQDNNGAINYIDNANSLTYKDAYGDTKTYYFSHIHFYSKDSEMTDSYVSEFFGGNQGDSIGIQVCYFDEHYYAVYVFN